MAQKSIRTRKKRSVTSRRTTAPNAAGIDLGATVDYAAVPEDRDPEHPVRHFGTLTEDLEALADWLKACAITTVAMEATGVYWIPLFQILEDRGFVVCLVNARQHLLRVQKALDQMNVQLHHAVTNITNITNITGVTGLTILEAIAAGERDPKVLAAHRDYRCKKSEAQIAKALKGDWREEHLFTLR